MGAALQLPSTCPWVFSHLNSPHIRPRGCHRVTGFEGRAGCSVNPAASETLPEHGAKRSLPLRCQERSKQQNSLCKKRVFTGPLSQAAWLSQLVCANKHADFFSFKETNFSEIQISYSLSSKSCFLCQTRGIS